MQTNAALAATRIRLGHYEIDDERSALTFTTRHLFGLAPVRGTFAIRRGTADIAEPIGESAVYAEIETASFRTNNRQRDRRVRSPRFLDARRYPVITFSSGQIDVTSAKVCGILTVQGIARPVSMSVTACGPDGESVSISAVTRVDRFEFGITAAPGLAGRYLDLALEVTCVPAGGGPRHA